MELCDTPSEKTVSVAIYRDGKAIMMRSPWGTHRMGEAQPANPWDYVAADLRVRPYVDGDELPPTGGLLAAHLRMMGTDEFEFDEAGWHELTHWVTGERGDQYPCGGQYTGTLRCVDGCDRLRGVLVEEVAQTPPSEAPSVGTDPPAAPEEGDSWVSLLADCAAPEDGPIVVTGILVDEPDGKAEFHIEAKNTGTTRKTRDVDVFVIRGLFAGLREATDAERVGRVTFDLEGGAEGLQVLRPGKIYPYDTYTIMAGERDGATELGFHLRPPKIGAKIEVVELAASYNGTHVTAHLRVANLGDELGTRSITVATGRGPSEHWEHAKVTLEAGETVEREVVLEDVVVLPTVGNILDAMGPPWVRADDHIVRAAREPGSLERGASRRIGIADGVGWGFLWRNTGGGTVSARFWDEGSDGRQLEQRHIIPAGGSQQVRSLATPGNGTDLPRASAEPRGNDAGFRVNASWSEIEALQDATQGWDDGFYVIEAGNDTFAGRVGDGASLPIDLPPVIRIFHRGGDITVDPGAFPIGAAFRACPGMSAPPATAALPTPAPSPTPAPAPAPTPGETPTPTPAAARPAPLPAGVVVLAALAGACVARRRGRP